MVSAFMVHPAVLLVELADVLKEFQSASAADTGAEVVKCPGAVNDERAVRAHAVVVAAFRDAAQFVGGNVHHPTVEPRAIGGGKKGLRLAIVGAPGGRKCWRGNPLTCRARSVRGGVADEDGLGLEGFEPEPGRVVLPRLLGAGYPFQAANGNDPAAEPEERRCPLRMRPSRIEEQPCRSKLRKWSIRGWRRFRVQGGFSR